MHMRAHGNQYKTPQALSGSKPNTTSSVGPHVHAQVGSHIDVGSCTGNSTMRLFSCPYVGCTHNKDTVGFRPMKSVVCVKNHFKRSHFPKVHKCNRFNKKSFSVLADLRSHMKVCGVEKKWKCCCGNCYSKKDKLFAHIASFEGHMPMPMSVPMSVSVSVSVSVPVPVEAEAEAEAEASLMDEVVNWLNSSGPTV
ncbi:hypothetical protein RND81_06G029500 [Saponaria officinalis]|uniref:C2H2-type domain-containing protein n=1 Tax=Saponaria officinalis TaxID=3572 RepID=A0AAW1K3X2_SAPOF